jgi:hypothetical protein
MRQCIESGEKDMARIYQTVALGDLGKQDITLDIPKLREANQATADKLINKLRATNVTANGPDGKSRQYNSEFGNLASIGENGYFSTTLFDVLNTRFDTKGIVHVEGAHANAVLSMPQLIEGKWKMKVWEPFVNQHPGDNRGMYKLRELKGDYSGLLRADGTVDVNIKNSEGKNYLQLLADDGIQLAASSEQIFDFIAKGSFKPAEYDLTNVFDMPEFVFISDMLKDVKLQGLQTNAQDCVPYSWYVSMILQSMQPEGAKYAMTSEGRAKFEKEFNVRLLRYGDFFKDKANRSSVPTEHNDSEVAIAENRITDEINVQLGLIKSLISDWKKTKSSMLLTKMSPVLLGMDYQKIPGYISNLENNEHELRKLALQLVRVQDLNKSVNGLKVGLPFAMTVRKGVVLTGKTFTAYGFKHADGSEYDLSASRVTNPQGDEITATKILHVDRLTNDEGKVLWSSEIYEKLMKDLENNQSTEPKLQEVLILDAQAIGAELKGNIQPKQAIEKLRVKLKESLDKSMKGVDMKLTVDELKQMFKLFIEPMLDPLLKQKGVEKIDISGLAIESLDDGTYSIGGIDIKGKVGMFTWQNKISISLQPQADGMPQVKLNHSNPFIGGQIDNLMVGLNEKLQTPKILAFLNSHDIQATGISVTVAPGGQLSFALKK